METWWPLTSPSKLDKKNQLCGKDNESRRDGMAYKLSHSIFFVMQMSRKVLQKLEVNHGLDGGCTGFIGVDVIGM